MSLRFGLVSTFFMALLLCAGQASAVSMTTFDLKPAVIIGNQARLAVEATFAPDDPLEELIEFQLTVENSSDNLTSAGTDYTRFSFDLDAALVAGGWMTFADFGFAGPGDFLSQSDVLFDPGLPAGGPHLLGDIVIDLTGLAGQPAFVSIQPADPISGTAALSIDSQFALIDNDIAFLTGRQDFTVPAISDGIVPEPATGVLAVAALAMAALVRARRRGAA